MRERSQMNESLLCVRASPRPFAYVQKTLHDLAIEVLHPSNSTLTMTLLTCCAV